MSKTHKSVFDMTDDELKEHAKELFSDANKVEYRKLHDTDNVKIGYREDKPFSVLLLVPNDVNSWVIDYDEWLFLKSELGIDESMADVYDIISDYMEEDTILDFGIPSDEDLAKSWY